MWKAGSPYWPSNQVVLFVVLMIVLGCSEQQSPQKASTMTTSSQPGQNTVRLDETSSELTWNWRYDSKGQLVEIVAPGSMVTRITYAQSEAAAGGVETSTVVFRDERRKFKRNIQGYLLSAEGAEGTISFSYNAIGLPTAVHSDGAPTIRYVYDVQDRLVEMRIGTGAAIQYRYDYLGRLATVTTPVGDITYSYQRAANTVIRRLPNGIRTLRKFDDEGRLIELIHIDTSNYIIVQYAYGYRPDGLIARIAEKNQRIGERMCQYAYDLMQRLTAVECQGSGRSYRYRYDSLGNLAESQTTGGEALRFTSTLAGVLATDSRGTSRTDARGHIRQLPGPPESIDYDFNGAGEFISAKGKSLLYTYNALGLLTARRVKDRETRYLPNPFADAWQPLWRRNANGKEDVIIWDGAVPVVELRDKGVRYRLEDHVGSVRVEVDGRGGITAWHDYAPYGAPEDAGIDGDLIPAFAGLFWDPAARVYPTQARAYDPITARFLQPDPQIRVPRASKHSHSLYAYSGGDPVNFVDRNGRAPEPVSHWWDLPRTFLTELPGTTWEGLQAAGSFWGRTFKSVSAGHGLGWEWGPQPGTWAHQAGQLGGPGAQTLVQGILGTALAFEMVAPIASSAASGGLVYKAAMGTQQTMTSAARQVLRFSSQMLGKGGGGLQFQTGMQPQVLTQLVQGSQAAQVHGVNLVTHLSRASGGWSPALNIAQKAVVSSLAGSLIWLNTAGFSELMQAPTSRGGLGYGEAADTLATLGSTVLGSTGDEPGGDLFFSAPGGSDGTSAVAPSNVGGVYLGGAGKTLEGLGHLNGIAVDEETGKLVLIGFGEQRIALPPLRLDDIVTVFRAVYNHGEPPSVTIDPDELDPEGPIMHVKHGPGTDGTYVGWILFECDRIMKTYQLGQDNVTGDPLHSRILGYAETLDAVFFGDSSHGSVKNSTWERFWIVPASARRFDAAATDLSLFEVPLKVNTQKMRWVRGKLVDDETGKSSFGANTFKTWFTEHYDDIADEVLVSPPPGSGFVTPIPIFHELRRIALIAAIAERLRDQGETMPLWMRDYPVASFPIPETTPSLTIEKKRVDGSVIRIATIYGGVNLAPADKDVRKYSDVKGTTSATVSPEDAVFVAMSRQGVASLASEIPELARVGEAIGKARTITTTDGKTVFAAVLPGADTRALVPNRQRAIDMVVPIGLGRSIRLTRYYNSFFDPVGEYGSGWTLDLPELLVTKMPVSRDGKRSQYRVVHLLVSPLGSVDIRFDRTERVEPYGVEMHVAKDHSEIAGVAYGSNEITRDKTQQVLFRNGTVWHFDDDGRLVLTQADGTVTHYVRDTVGRVIKIVGYIGRDAVAEIRLRYDQQDRITEAKAKQAEPLYKQAPAEVSELRFEYGNDGRLTAVTRSGIKEGKTQHLKYRYVDNRLTEIASEDGPDSSFGYSERGQLLWEKQGDQKRVYTVANTSQGTVLTVAMNARAENGWEWTYDAHLRPVAADLGGGRTVTWQYGTNNEVRETISQAGKTIWTRLTSWDGSTETTVLNNGPTYELRWDVSGRPTTLSREGILVAQVFWRPDGKLGGLRAGTTEIHLRRHEDGWPNGVLISAPMKSGKTNNWFKTEWDLMGRPIKITDSSGFEYRVDYDVQGQLRSFGRLTEGGKVIGTILTYDGDGRIVGVDSSWSKEKREYADGGVLKKIEVERQGVRSVTTFDAFGRPVTRSAFDGGTTTWHYKSDEARSPLQAIELPNGERIDYKWITADETGDGDVSLGPAVFRMRSDTNGRVTTVTWGKQGR